MQKTINGRDAAMGAASPHGMTRREMLGCLAAAAALKWTSAEAATGAAPLQAAASAGSNAAPNAVPNAAPNSAIIRTLLEDLRPEALGSAVTLFHEHLSFEWARVRGPNGRGNLTGPDKDVALVSDQLDVAVREGVGCIVDAGTTDIGRDVAFLRQIAAKTRMKIVASGGFYMQRTYPADFATKSEEQIADELAQDARQSRYGALGEIGETPDAPMSALERKFFRAVGKAHLRTNLPVYTHNAYGTGPNVPRDAALRQLDAFESAGVDPRRVAIGHTCCLDDPTADIIKQLAKRGSFVGFDRTTAGAVPDDKKVTMVLAFLEAGYADHLLLSSDYNFTARSAARPGYGSTFTVFVPKLRAAGVKENTLRRITVDNPRRFLAFAPKS
jgi:predicted metal-dependent phosphotriesterase family hydrolase